MLYNHYVGIWLPIKELTTDEKGKQNVCTQNKLPIFQSLLNIINSLVHFFTEDMKEPYKRLLIKHGLDFHNSSVNTFEIISQNEKNTYKIFFSSGLIKINLTKVV